MRLTSIWTPPDATESTHKKLSRDDFSDKPLFNVDGNQMSMSEKTAYSSSLKMYKFIQNKALNIL
ncbi:hypothetical protein AM10699_45360 [Acaryochloris marina MBIC10699]|nr:hypothetical protein AM10699_45360 [Acaryochloris marina MBIC10699]